MFHKYLAVFKASWSNSIVYRLNFFLWRFRNIIVILTVYFLWEAIFTNNGVVFGYTRATILTYVFLTLILRSLILGQKSIDAAGEISDGRLSNYLLKPLNYHWYWFSRDMADKILNVFFSFLEIGILYFLLRPPFFFQFDSLTLIFFLVAVVAAMLLNFVLGNIASYFSFWTPGNAWGFWFIYLVFQDFLGGVMFPLDVFPKVIYNAIMLTPFPYLLFFPVNIYLGKITGPDIINGFLIMGIWVVLAIAFFKQEWTLGLKSYQAEGR